MNFRSIAFALLLACLVLCGRANTTQQHFDPDAAKSLSSKTLPRNTDRAAVYLMRE